MDSRSSPTPTLVDMRVADGERDDTLATPKSTRLQSVRPTENGKSVPPGKTETSGGDDIEVERDGEVYDFPDGGRGWLVVAGCGHIMFATFGFINAWGVFQAEYETMFYPESSSTIAWIGSLQYCLTFLPSLVTGRLLDIGKWQIPFYIAAVILPVSMIITAQVKEFWQALLVQGILFGTASGFLFGPALSVAGHWFQKKRAFAFGMVAACSSIGGTVFPILVRQCINKVGFPWALRICGFVLAYATLFACLTMRTRLPPKRVAGGIFDIKAFKHGSYSFYVLGCFVVLLGLYTPLTYFETFGSVNGLGTYSSYLISIANAASLIGRIVPALFADKIGVLNFLIPGLIGSAVTTFIWPICTGKTSLTILVVFNGIFQGSFVSLYASGVAQLGTADDLGRRIGMLVCLLSPALLVGTPISGAILSTTSSYHDVSYYAGVSIIVGAALLSVSRYCALSGFVGRI
ncbi:hypothetical protein P7C73_g927, partial [Tremellales sp. Uapishka_1]